MCCQQHGSTLLYRSFVNLIMPGSNVVPLRQSRDAIEDIYGPRTPYKHIWPSRVDEQVIEEPEKWVQSACILCR